MDDNDFMKMAIDAARKSEAEDSRIHPKVGAVLVREGEQTITSYRGEFTAGDHAEFTLLEKKLANEKVAGATVYSTLEPCTARNHPKVPCVERLIERKVSRVVIGMLDPNPMISGKGVQRLRQANIQVDLCASELMAEIEELNRDFIREQTRQGELLERGDPELIRRLSRRGLDEWYRVLNYTYWNQNFHRDPSSIFAHLVEVVGGLSAFASNKRKSNLEPEAYIAKAFAWWAALWGKLGIRSVEAMLWDKFPGVCPYCQKKPHDPDVCSHQKLKSGGPPWELLGQLGEKSGRPSRLREWQLLFSGIYPAQQTEEYGPSFARLTEELGELAEAVRVFKAEPGYLLSEAADVFAWLMHIQNIADSRRGISPDKRGTALEIAFATGYPDGCRECRNRICKCPPILPSTIGRIAHEVPPGRATFDPAGRFMSADQAGAFFQDMS